MTERYRAKRIIVVCGHYGSGKSEFSVSLAMLLARQAQRPYPRLALADIDIANPYFRSRERRTLLEENGVRVCADGFDRGLTAELPALDAGIKGPLEDKGCRVILDAGGDSSGARVLHQFIGYLTPAETTVLLVVNASRPETADRAGALAMLAAIEAETGLRVDALVNNTHMLRETTPEVIAHGHALCEEIKQSTGKQLFCDCYPAPLVDPAQLTENGAALLPIGLYLRPSWLDK